MDDNITRCVGNIIAKFLVGYTIEKDDNRFENLRKLLLPRFQLTLSPSARFLVAFPWLRFVPVVNKFLPYQQLLNLRKQFQQFIQEEMDKAKNNLDKRPANSFVSAFYREMERRTQNGIEEGTFREDQLLMAMNDLWVAGMETTVTTLLWAILLLLRHPEIQEKVFQEIEKVVGFDGLPTTQHKIHLPYTMATINEIQRWANIIPLNLEHSVHRDTKLGGYDIPKGITVWAQISAVHNDPDIFPNPDVFDPTRFLDESLNPPLLLKIHQFQPFSLGKRQCLGESLAKMQLFLVLSCLIQRFEFSVSDTHDPPSLEPILGMTLTPHSYHARIRIRNP